MAKALIVQKYSSKFSPNIAFARQIKKFLVWSGINKYPLWYLIILIHCTSFGFPIVYQNYISAYVNIANKPNLVSDKDKTLYFSCMPNTAKELDITNESQEVSPFPAGDHKASINRCAWKHNKNKTEIK